MIFWLGYVDFNDWWNYNIDLAFWSMGYSRFQWQYGKESELFNGGKADFRDPTQGSIGNCYIMASMIAVSTKPGLIEKVFVTKEKNEPGIYIVNFYIRGIPWKIAVDDGSLFAFDIDNHKYSRFSQFEKHQAIWPSIIEKAFSKIKGSYKQAVAGMNTNGLRTLTGAPTFEYDLESTDLDQIWELMTEAQKKDYILAAAVLSPKTPTEEITNHCGILMKHAYAIIDLFTLKDPNDNIMEKMIMIRNPNGNEARHYNGKSSTLDYASWTPSYIN